MAAKRKRRVDCVGFNSRITDDPRILSVGPLGFALHVAAISYCVRNQTEQLLPLAKVATLLDFSGVHIDTANPVGLPAHCSKSSMGGRVVDPMDVVYALIDAGLWRRCEEDEQSFVLLDLDF